MGTLSATGSAATQRLESGRILWSAADAAATRHRRQLDYCKSNGWAGLFSYWRCGIGRRPVVVTWHLEGCDVGHEGGASFGGCLAVCRQPGRGRERLPHLARTVVLSGPLSTRRALSRYWPVSWVMIWSGEHFGVTSRGPRARRAWCPRSHSRISLQRACGDAGHLSQALRSPKSKQTHS